MIPIIYMKLISVHNNSTTGTCYMIDEGTGTPSVKPLFEFSGNFQYYQTKVKHNEEAGMKYGVSSMGHSLTWSHIQETFVIGSPNFNLGDPVKNRMRYGGFGNILRYGRILDQEGNRITNNNTVFNNPTKGRGSDKGFREELKKEYRDKEQGTPAMYLGWAVITGNVFKLLKTIFYIYI